MSHILMGNGQNGHKIYKSVLERDFAHPPLPPFNFVHQDRPSISTIINQLNLYLRFCKETFPAERCGQDNLGGRALRLNDNFIHANSVRDACTKFKGGGESTKLFKKLPYLFKIIIHKPLRLKSWVQVSFFQFIL